MVHSARRPLLLLVSLGLSCVTCYVVEAQPRDNRKPSFAGTWRLDKSKEPEERVGDLIMVIEHNDPAIKFTRTFKSQLYSREDVLTYYTDERGEENTDNGSIDKSKTKWDGRSIMTKSSSMMRVAGDRIDIFRTDKWQMSEDGRVLKQTITYRRTTSNPLAAIRPEFEQVTHTFIRVP